MTTRERISTTGTTAMKRYAAMRRFRSRQIAFFMPAPRQPEEGHDPQKKTGEGDDGLQGGSDAGEVQNYV